MTWIVLNKLNFIDYTHVDNWPNTSKVLGAISAVALDVYKNVVVFHRANRIWNTLTFDNLNIFRQRNLGAIPENTIITFDRDTGNVINEWGSKMFYMPHGLHINGNYYYITDVGKNGNQIKNSLKMILINGKFFQLFIKFFASTLKIQRPRLIWFWAKLLSQAEAQILSVSQHLSRLLRMETFSLLMDIATVEFSSLTLME